MTSHLRCKSPRSC